MEELTAGIRDLHDRVKHLDDQLRERGEATDLHERLGAAAMQVAERTRAGMRWLWIVGTLVALVWSPLVAYGAVWSHEKIRNDCYPVAVWDVAPPPGPLRRPEPWWCHAFPGTDHPAGHPAGH